MSVSLIKSSLAVVVLGTIGASGFGIYKVVFSSKTIKEFILSSKERDDTYSFLSEDSNDWIDIKAEYTRQGAKYKPVQNGVEVDQRDLPTWCISAIKGSFLGEGDAKYKSVLRWCYLNMNNFEKQMDVKGGQLVGEKVATGGAISQDWKNAWTRIYKPDKGEAEWKITDGETNLNGEDEANGAIDLQKWCVKKLEKFMYTEEAKNDFRKFFRFCTKNKNS